MKSLLRNTKYIKDQQKIIFEVCHIQDLSPSISGVPFHKKDAQKFEVEEDNDGFGTPPSIKHRIPANRKSPPAPTKPRLGANDEEEAEMCVDVYHKRWIQCLDPFFFSFLQDPITESRMQERVISVHRRRCLDFRPPFYEIQNQQGKKG